jgi:hypothetical protein
MNKSHLAEAIHQEANARAHGANHLRQQFKAVKKSARPYRET